MRILGISAFYHDSAAALIVDGNIASAGQEERFTRKKHDASFPINAIKFCLSRENITLDEVDYIVFYEKPFLKFERLFETYLATAPRGFNSFKTAMPLWAKEKLLQKNIIISHLKQFSKKLHVEDSKLLFSEHHLSHAASAFYPSPFKKAAILTLDGVGEWATSTVSIGDHSHLEIIKQINFPHSLGLLYSAFTYYTGFKVNSGEYKLMGLAPYGRPIYAQKIYDNLIDLKPDGSFKLNMDYFSYHTGLTMVNKNFHRLFEGEPRKKESEITQKEMDLAASIQLVLEEAVLRIARSTAQETAQENLCLAGGVALNCVANGKILKHGIFKNVWIQPAAGDAGGALGAALAAYYLHAKQPRISLKPKSYDGMQGSYLGSSFEPSDIVSRLKKVGAHFVELNSDEEIVSKTAACLAKKKAIGWFQGRAEFGPRALGGRSILADPRCSHMQRTLNLKVKYRESFRPFAPSVLFEDANKWFELNCESPYMLLVADLQQDKRIKMTASQQKLFGIEKLNVMRSSLPAVTHVDYSARVQTVHRQTNSLYHALLREFKNLTGCPVLVNTSFNVRGEPIVETPEDAFRCFMNTELDYLVVGRCFLDKKDQTVDREINYKEQFELD